MILELVYCGVVHYRRYDKHKDIEEWKQLVKKNPLYTIREMKINEGKT